MCHNEQGGKPDRYIVTIVRANGVAARYELCDTQVDGGEGEPLILAGFFTHHDAYRAAECMNACDGVDRPANLQKHRGVCWSKIEAVLKAAGALCNAAGGYALPKNSKLPSLIDSLEEAIHEFNPPDSAGGGA